MARSGTKEEIIREEYRAARKNADDQVYINIAKFFGAILILTGIGVLIAKSLRFDLTSIFLFVVGLAIISGAALWETDDKRTIDKLKDKDDDLEVE